MSKETIPNPFGLGFLFLLTWTAIVIAPGELRAAIPGDSEDRGSKHRHVSLPIRRAVEKSFSRLDVPYILDVFDNPKNTVVHKKPRIQAALVILAKGNVKKFDKSLKDARSDWRDVLLYSGLEEANWPEVAARKGIPGLRK